MRARLMPSARFFCAALLLFLTIPTHAINKDSLIAVFPTVTNTFDRVRLIFKILENPDPDKGLYHHQKLLDITRQQKDETGEAAVTCLIGFAELLAGNTATGTEIQFNALRMAEKARSKQVMGMSYLALSLLYFDNPPKQKQYLDLSLAASTAAKDYLFVCFALNALSYYYYDIPNKLDSALYFNQRALELATTHKLREVLPVAFTTAGDNSYKMGQKNLALEYYRAALREPYLQDEPGDKGAIYQSIAAMYTAEGNMDSALFYARLQRDAVKHLSYVFQKNPAYYLWKAFENRNSDSALKYATEYYAIRDSMFSAGKMQQIQAMAMLEDDRQRKLKEERSHSLQYAAIAMVLVSLLITFLVVSHSIIANPKLIKVLGVILLLMVFEFLNLLLHPFLVKITHHSPVLLLLAMVGVAAALVPMHHKIEHWITQRLVEKNNRIRLKAAKRTIEQLEGALSEK